MWTKKSNFLVCHLRVKGFCLPLAVLPFRCLDESIEGIMDILSLFRPFSKKALSAVTMLQVFFDELRAYGRLDMINVKAHSDNHPVHVSLLLR